VAIGVGLAALVMVMIYLPPLFPNRPEGAGRPKPRPLGGVILFAKGNTGNRIGGGKTILSHRLGDDRAGSDRSGRGAVAFTGPGWTVAGTPCARNVARRKTALDEIKSSMGLPPDPLWLIISGRDDRKSISVFPLPKRCSTTRLPITRMAGICLADRALAAGRIAGGEPDDGCRAWEAGTPRVQARTTKAAPPTSISTQSPACV